ncbi:MAG: winged helix-turn-helix transcriptional regulator [Candidatus Hodarchaeales archaeon]
MSNEEIQVLRTKVWELTQANQAYQQENVRLQTRISELYDWSNKAQQVILERDEHIKALNLEIEQLKQKEKERMQRRNEATLDDLYEKVQKLEIENRSYKAQLEEYGSIIEEIYRSIELPVNLRSQIEQIFRTTKDPQKILMIELRKNPSMNYNELSRKTGLSIQKVKMAADQLRRKGFIQEVAAGEGVMAGAHGKTQTMTNISDWDRIEDPEKLFNLLVEFIRVTDQNIQISEALKKFRDVLTSLIGTPQFMYEISRAISDFRISMKDKNDLIKKILTWQDKWEASVRGKERYGTTIEDPSNWNSGLTSDELFESMGRYIRRAKHTEIASALEKIRDILYEKHGSFCLT